MKGLTTTYDQRRRALIVRNMISMTAIVQVLNT